MAYPVAGSANGGSLNRRGIVAETRPAPIVPAALGRFGVGLLIVGRAAAIVARADRNLVVGIVLLGPLTLVLRRTGLEQLLPQRFISRAADCRRGGDSPEHKQSESTHELVSVIERRSMTRLV